MTKQGQEVAVKEPAQTGVQVYNPFGGVRALGKGVICPPEEFVSLVWATGTMGAAKVVVDKETGEVTQEAVQFAGFFFDMDDPELNRAARAAKLGELVLDHEKEAKKHFVLSEDEEYHFVLRRIVSWDEERQSNARHGLARGSRYQRTKDKAKKVIWAKPQHSYAYIMVFPVSLLNHGYHKPLIICSNSSQTEDLLKVLGVQFRVIRYADKLNKKNGIEMDLPFHSYHINVKPSKKQRLAVGKDGSKKITVMEAPLSMLSPEYLQEHEMSLEFAELFEEYSEYSEKWSTELVISISNKDREAEVERDKANEANNLDPFKLKEEDHEKDGDKETKKEEGHKEQNAMSN